MQQFVFFLKTKTYICGFGCKYTNEVHSLFVGLGGGRGGECLLTNIWKCNQNIMWHGLQVGLNSGKKGNLKTELLWISKRHSRSNIDLSINELPYTLILLDLRLCDVAPSIWKSCPRNLSPKEKRKKQSFSLLDTWKWLNSCFWRSEFGSNLFFGGGMQCFGNYKSLFQ